jgi:hypothetical protein
MLNFVESIESYNGDLSFGKIFEGHRPNGRIDERGGQIVTERHECILESFFVPPPHRYT